MSLKFLAVGQSVAGLRSDKSAYAVRKENQLPTFESAPRFKHPEKTMVQTDWLQVPRPAADAPISAEQPIERQLPITAVLPSTPVKKKRGWLSFFGLKWFRTGKTRDDFVQSELSLEKVQPLRNDLADADLRLVLKRRSKKVSMRENPRAGAAWSELTARLFELGQK